MEPVEVRGASILLVDDQDSSLAEVAQLLKTHGYANVHVTNNPEQVLKLQQEHSFDLIMLDLDLPGTDGYQIMKELKTNTTDPYLSLIALTGHPEHKLRALQAGAKDFISEPFNTVELLTRIGNILEVRLLYAKLKKVAEELELEVQERTAMLQESEARFRAFTDLASDWYWEQDDNGNFTKVSGPVPEILGIQVDFNSAPMGKFLGTGWDEQEQSLLRAKIEARESFLDFKFTRTRPNGELQTFLVSGQPMFDRTCHFLGYRGVGVDISVAQNL